MREKIVLKKSLKKSLGQHFLTAPKTIEKTVGAAHVTKEDIVVSNNLQRKTKVESSGQGLTNIIERYAYFTKRKVSIRETNKVYEVSVPLLIVEL